ncbi:hypothetical protein DV736_g4958, partial [Chaetothyriales sp. CBS 134916]
MPFVSALMIKKPATLGVDFAGIVVTPAAGSLLKTRQVVFRAAKKFICRNVELCKSIGADEAIDYTQSSVVEGLKKSVESKQKRYDVIVDNVFLDTSIFYRAHEFTTPQARYVNISLAPISRYIWEWLKMNLIPATLEDFEQIRTWMAEGKVKVVIDSKYPFEQAPEAFKKLKTSRAVGKVIVEVADAPT